MIEAGELGKLPKHVYSEPDRHGNARYYFRIKGKGPRVRLWQTPGTPEFDDEIACARLGLPYAPKAPAIAPAAAGQAAPAGSLDWLIDVYEKRGAPLVSADLADRRLRMLREIADFKKGDRRCGGLPFASMARRHVLEIRDAIRETPGARNNVVKALGAMFAWAIDAGIAKESPAAGVKRMKSGDGFHTWTVDEIDRYVARHPAGTMAHRALVVFLFSGLRLADAAILGRQHIYFRRDPDTGAPARWIRITPAKTRKSSGVVVDIPVLPELGREIDAAGNAMTFILSAHGAPYTTKGLGNRVRDWCDQAGLPHCSAHGLRKAGATIAAENGADYELLKAVFGWTTAQQASHYVQKARRTRIAARAGRFLYLGQSGN